MFLVIATSAVLAIAGGGFGTKPLCPIENCNAHTFFVHRGIQHLPENSLPAFTKAHEMGFPGIELDIRITADNRLVVFHDANAMRLLGQDFEIEEQQLAMLTQQQLNPATTDANVVSLDTVLGILGNRMQYYLDIKVPEMRVARRLQFLLNKHKLHKQVWVASEDLLFLGYLEAQNPDIITVQEAFDPGKEWLYYVTPKKFKPDFYSGSLLYINEEHLDFLKSENLLDRRVVFDVNHENIDTALEMGFHHIILDHDSSQPDYDSLVTKYSLEQ